MDGTGRGKADKGRARGHGKRQKASGGRGPAATLGSSCGVATGLLHSGGLGVALPCGSAMVGDCSYVGRRLSPRDGAIIRELNETVVAEHFLETGGTGYSESRGKVAHATMSTDLPSPALRRLHSVISDFRPPSVTESGEAALRRLHASRPIGGYSLTSDDPAPASLTVFQSSRVDHGMRQKLPHLESPLRSSVRSYLDTYEQRLLGAVSEVADMDTRLGPVGRYFDPVFQHSRRNHRSFVRDLVEAGSVGFVEAAVTHVGLFLVAKKAGAQRFIIDARASNPHFLRPQSGPLLTREGLCHVEFQGAPGDAQNWFVGSADIKNALSSNALSWMVPSVFCAPRCPRVRSLVPLEKRVNRKRLAPDSLIFHVPTTHPMGFSWAVFFCQDVTDHCTLAGSADSPLFVCRDNSGSKHGMESAGFRWYYADNFPVLARGENCSNVHLASFIAGVQKASLDVHDVFLASGFADLLVMNCPRPTRTALERANCYHVFVHSGTVSSRRHIDGRAMELVNGHESFLESWCSFNP